VWIARLLARIVVFAAYRDVWAEVRKIVEEEVPFFEVTVVSQWGWRS